MTRFPRSGHFQSRISGMSSPTRDVLLVFDQLDMQALLGERGHVAQARHAVEHVHGQVIAVDLIHHGHVKRCGGGAFFLVSAHVQVGVIGTPIGQPVDQPGISVEGEDNRLVGGEE